MPTRQGSEDRRSNRAKRSVQTPEPKVVHSPPAESEDAAPVEELEPAASLSAEAAGSAPSTPAGNEQPEAAVSAGKKALRRNPLFPVGVNYHPVNSESDGWEEWYRHDFVSDFEKLAAARFSLVKVFLSWKVLEPQVGQYDEESLERFADLLASARENRLQVIVCFFADDRHAELAEVSWGKRRDPRTDQYLVSRQMALVQKIVNRFRGESAIFAWELANEAFLSGFSSLSDLESWATSMREAVREIDPRRPVTLSLDVSTYLKRTGLDAGQVIDRCEFAVTHATTDYRIFAAIGPSSETAGSWLDSFLLRAAARGLPVLMDDVGPASLESSPAEEAAQVRTALYSGLMNRAAGVVLRRYKDMDTDRREPYYCDPFEALVGIADKDGRPKTTFGEVESFIRVVAGIDLRHYRQTPERVAIMLPSEVRRSLPSMAGLYTPRSCFRAYIAAKEVHLPVAVTHEGDPVGEYAMLVVPSAFRLEDSTWEELAGFVQSGGSLVMSYGGGDTHPAAREIFGVEFLGDSGARESLSCRVAQSEVFGALRSFDVSAEIPHFALLGSAGATVVATDSKGSPLLTLNGFGQGKAIFIAAPAERAIAQAGPWKAPLAIGSMLREIYGSVARKTGCALPMSCDRHSVEVALFSGESDDVVVLFNHALEKSVVTLTFERKIVHIADVRGGRPVMVNDLSFGLPVEGGAGTALRITY